VKKLEKYTNKFFANTEIEIYMNIITLRKIINLLKNLFCSFLYCSGFLLVYNKFPNRSKRNYIIIVGYHNIRIKKLFSKHIEYFKQKYDIISIDEAIELLSGDKNFNPKLVITFDDGYKNTYSVAKNITRNKIPICIYLSTYYIESGDVFWWDTLLMMAKKDKKLAQHLLQIEQTLVEMPQEERDSKIEELLQYYATDRKVYDFESEVLPLSWKDIEKMKEYNVDFEAHGHHHYVLTNARLSTIKDDIEINKELIEKKLSLSCKHFAYPGGYYNEEIIQVLKEYGFVSAVTIKYGINTKNTDLFELYRIGISDEDWIPTVAVKLSGLWDMVKLIDKLI